MDGVSAAASVITLLGIGGHLVRISSNLWNAAQTIESTEKTLSYIKVEVENLVPVCSSHLFLAFLGNSCEGVQFRW
jgi:hypothetical protein